MKLIIATPPRCDCMTKLHDYEVELGGLNVGSQVECDCGVAYTKQDSQRDGVYWARTPGRPRVIGMGR